MNTSPSPPTAATLVLVDPTFPDGESSLDLVDGDEDHVLVVVLVTGRSSHALHDRARRAGCSVTTAAWAHLERLAVRISRPGRIVGTIVATGPDPAVELAAIATEHPTRRIVLPVSSVEADHDLVRRVVRRARVPVVHPEPAAI